MNTTAQVCGIADPAHPVELERLLRADPLAADRVVAVVGKVDGSGNGNDMSRELAASRIRDCLVSCSAGDRTIAVSDVPVVLSSGCAGLISPNLTVFTRHAPPADSHGPTSPTPGLAVGCARSEVIEPQAVGRMAQVDAVADATRRALLDAGPLDSVACVLVKTPSLRPDDVRRLGSDLRTRSTAESMAFANDAAALGVAVALGEVDRAALSDEAIRRDWNLYSDVAIVSAGPEIRCAEVIVLGNGAAKGGHQRIERGLLRDPLDRDGVVATVEDARAALSQDVSPADFSDVVQVFAKLILPVDDSVRGYPTSFFQEPSPAATAKAIGAALVGSVIGRPNVFVSGGERGSHQGPPGAGPVAVIVRRLP